MTREFSVDMAWMGNVDKKDLYVGQATREGICKEDIGKL